MRVSVNPFPFWRVAPAATRVSASSIYLALLASVTAVIAGAVAVPVAGVLGIVLAIITGYVLWDSATVVLKGGRVGSVLALVFSAAITAYLGSTADAPYSMLMFAVAGYNIVGVALLFTSTSRVYQSNSESLSAKQILSNARTNRASNAPGEDGEAGEGQPSASVPANRQQRRAAQRAGRKPGSTRKRR